MYRFARYTLESAEGHSTQIPSSEGMSGHMRIPSRTPKFGLRIKALALAGDSDAVRLEYDAARHRIEQDEGLLADLDPGTQALFESVLRRAS